MRSPGCGCRVPPHVCAAGRLGETAEQESRFDPGVLNKSHPDYPILARIAKDVKERLGRRAKAAFAERVLEAVDFVLDPQRTARTEIDDLDRVEKAFIGLKVEHFVRDLLDAPLGIRRDIELGGMDVDIKNTIRRSRTWMIPSETYSREEPVLVIASDAKLRTSSMGVLVARDAYLGAENRDRKRGVLSSAQSNVFWIIEDMPWPASRWDGIDMVRFRDLRTSIRKGADRAAAFFRENPDRPTHRSVLLALLHDQNDPMKRLRGNGGARDALKREGVVLLSRRYGGNFLETIGRPIGKDEFIALKPDDPDVIARLQADGRLP